MSNYTYYEIRSQSESLKKTWEMLDERKIESTTDQTYLFTGCGTSYYLAIAAARFFQTVTKKNAHAVPASEIFMNPDQVFVPNQSYKVITISRSGTTSEIISALNYIKDWPTVTTLAVTCDSQAEMAQISDENISLNFINEKSVVMTQSYSCMYYALQLFAAKLDDDQQVLEELKLIPGYAEKILSQTQEIKTIADQLKYKRFIFLGSGLYNGIACEGTLKLKEMTQTECETYSKLEFRHGPISIVDRDTVAIIICEEKTKQLDQSLSKDIQEFGGYTIAIGNHVEEETGDLSISLNTPLSDYSSSILIVPFLQMLAYHRAMKLDLNPDQPRNLNQVVKISLPY